MTVKSPPGKPLLGQTPSQTVGPYFAYGLTPSQYGYDWPSVAGSRMADETTAGLRIRIEGQVLDGAGTPVEDALIEILQADSRGHYADAANTGFTGFGRCGTGTEPEGFFRFETIKPGPVGEGQAPHVNVTVLMRGLLLHVFTRLYFADEAQSNAADPVLAMVPAERRHTLIAARAAPGLYRFDIHMQGENETVFFDL
jgi:protocatechuate 3,4-dioxygenase, alpha subunit